MPELRISPEIRALLGPEGLARAAEISLSGGQCATRREPLQDRVNMVLRTGGSFTHVVYVHDRCGPSELVRMGRDFASSVPADGCDMTMTAAVVDHGGAALPVLVAETVSKAYIVNDGPGELTDIVTSHLLGRGFTLVSRLRQAPPQVPKWVGVLLLGQGPAPRRGTRHQG
ncbi:hypothetical protein [Streptomyces sp. NPDC048508]|uniref:hypothetical protein n=1 Tax=Streptomyces sp. NPDC048508 TaxID=3365561 RepID=UPI0037147C51